MTPFEKMSNSFVQYTCGWKFKDEYNISVGLDLKRISRREVNRCSS